MNNIFLRLNNNLKAIRKYNYLKRLDVDEYVSFLKKEYKERTGELLNLDDPKKYTEKMQYSKLYDNTPLKTKLTDKYLVREWVADRVGSEYLIPLLGVWDNYSDINFDKLPNRFVIKTNHGSGWNLVVQDKKKINHFKTKIKFDRWMNMNFDIIQIYNYTIKI